MVLICYRHDFRVSELVALRWWRASMPVIFQSHYNEGLLHPNHSI
jgi:hypothetical protein